MLLGVGDCHDDPVIVGSPLQPDVDAVAETTEALMHAFRDARDHAGLLRVAANGALSQGMPDGADPGVVAVDIGESPDQLSRVLQAQRGELERLVGQLQAVPCITLPFLFEAEIGRGHIEHLAEFLIGSAHESPR